MISIQLTSGIDGRVRLKALEIAKHRDEIAKKYNRVDGKIDCESNDLDINYIGAIGETWVHMVLGLPYAQPEVVDGVDTGDTDFIYKGEHIEAKTACFYKSYTIYFLDYLRYQKKKEITDKFLCMTINNRPNLADKLDVLGLITCKDVIKYPILEPEQDKQVKSTCYGIIIKDLINPEIYFRDIL